MRERRGVAANIEVHRPLSVGMEVVKPVKIFLVTDAFLPNLGGIEMQVSRLAAQQVSSGHDVTVLTTTMAKPSRGLSRQLAFVAEPPTKDRPYRVLRAQWKNPLGLPVAFAATKFAKLIEKEQPDVVHLQMGELTPTVMNLLYLLRKSGIPVAVSVHSVWSKRLTVYTYRALAWLTGVDKAPVVWAPVSELVGSRVRVALPEAEVVVQPNGVEAQRWRQDPVPHEGLVAVTATRFAPRKRVPALLRTLRRVGKELGQNYGNGAAPALRVVIAGDGRGLALARRYVSLAGMGGWVSLPGRLNEAELQHLYARSDVFVAAGVHDAFAIAGAEARSAGLALMARSQSGFGAELKQDVEGLSLDSDREMGDALVRWTREPGHRTVRRYKEHIRNSAYRHAWDEVLPQNERLYERAAELVSNPKNI